MDSIEKARGLVNDLLDLDDEQLAAIVPIPAAWARMILAAAPAQLPSSAADLDTMIDKASVFLTWLKTDTELSFMDWVGSLADASGAA